MRKRKSETSAASVVVPVGAGERGAADGFDETLWRQAEEAAQFFYSGSPRDALTLRQREYAYAMGYYHAAARAAYPDARDAARYRWLRAQDQWPRALQHLQPHALDAAIDAALAAEGKEPHD